MSRNAIKGADERGSTRSLERQSTTKDDVKDGQVVPPGASIVGQQGARSLDHCNEACLFLDHGHLTNMSTRPGMFATGAHSQREGVSSQDPLLQQGQSVKCRAETAESRKKKHEHKGHAQRRGRASLRRWKSDRVFGDRCDD